MPDPTDAARWSALWLRLGGVGAGTQVRDDLLRRYAEPHRAYHTVAHLDHVLSELDAMREVAAEPDLVEAALWFHDAVYDPRRHDNEERSADLAIAALAAAGITTRAAGRVAALVLVTKHHVPAESDRDAQVLCDADLAILGGSREEFDRYEREIRFEYGWVPDDAFDAGRTRVLQSFLTRARIYATDLGYERHEHRARENLRRVLSGDTAP